MGETTMIGWCDATWNGWEGCEKVGPGCDHCYAEARNARFNGGTAVNWGVGALRRRTSAHNWNEPRRWNQRATAAGMRLRVFASSLADVFDNAAPDGWRADLWELIAQTPALDWLLLTKRIGNAARMMPAAWRDAPPANVWVGATICNQTEADRDIAKLLRTPAALRFISLEPLLAPVDLTEIPVGGGHGHHEFDPIITANVLQRSDPAMPRIDWVIVGGESGPHARPFDLHWARALVAQCAEAGTPLFVKQLGTVPIDRGQRIWLARRKGEDPGEWPAELHVRKHPIPKDRGQPGLRHCPNLRFEGLQRLKSRVGLL